MWLLSAEAFLECSSQIHSSQDSNPTPPVQQPSHARRWINGNGKLCFSFMWLNMHVMSFNIYYSILFQWNMLRKWEEKRTWSPKRLEGNLEEIQGRQPEDESWVLQIWRTCWWELSHVHRWNSNVYKEKSTTHWSENVERYTWRCERVNSIWYIGNNNVSLCTNLNL